MSSKKKAPRGGAHIEQPVSGGIKPKRDFADPVTLKRGAIECWIGILDGAQRAAIAGAIPIMFAEAGPERAIEAYRRIGVVRDALRCAMEGGAL